jgi:hypothetical protein
MLVAGADPLRRPDRDGKRYADEPAWGEAQRSTRADGFFDSEAGARSRTCLGTGGEKSRPRGFYRTECFP